MNIALIHDKDHIKNFWEKKIVADEVQSETEAMRKSKSSLRKLRCEWVVRLENRNKHLKSLSEEYSRKAKVSPPEEEQT
ncbi:hypothetical protein NHX12_028401 [Muraenolepis orangiensis]|uniref:Protein FAM240A n=1 Tax=Muraenolepis orangiensis TaxID=630683 RepID=A0A9Q0IKA1_9TELE|nr:hypothetical protein NHX12_028401 [Muraenolepis orangiensis]